jgi:hypothetical protein
MEEEEEMSNLYREPSKDASYQVSVHLAMRFQRRFVRNQPIRNKNCLWRPCLLTDRDEMSNLYRGPSIDAFYQVSVHLTKRFHFFFFHLMATVNWLTILPPFGCAHKSLNILRRNTVKFIQCK